MKFKGSSKECKVNKGVQCPLFEKLKNTRTSKFEEQNEQKIVIKKNFDKYQYNFGNVATCANA